MTTPAEASQRRLALIVATSDYGDPTLQRLRAPGTDAEALADVLGDPHIGAFTVQVLLNLPSHELSRSLAQFCADSRPTDLLLLYVSCHGVLDDRGRLFYATVNTERRLLAATSVSAQWLNDQLEDCPARRQLLFLDCCHSGAFERGMKGDASLALRDRFGSRGRVVLTASRATEYSFEGEQVVGRGVSSFFTAAMVEGLRTGEADRDRDGSVTVRELYDHVFDRMRAHNARQTPAIWEDAAEGDILVAHNPHGPAVTSFALPDYLRAALGSPATGVRESAVIELAALLDRAEPGLALTARKALEGVVQSEIADIALLAGSALGAEPHRAAEQVHRKLEERASRRADEHAPQAKRIDHRAGPPGGDPARGVRERTAPRPPEQPTHHDARAPLRKRRKPASRHRSRLWVVILAASAAVGAAALLLTMVLWPRLTSWTITGQLPPALRANCSVTADSSATCVLTDGTVVFYRLFDTATEAQADVVNAAEPAPDGTPCPPPAPSPEVSIVCRYAVGAETGIAAFTHTSKDPQRFYEVRWTPDATPRLRGVMSTSTNTSQDWEQLRANWTQLATTR